MVGPVWYRMRSELRAHRAGAVGVALVVAAVGGLILALTAGVVRTLTTPERYTAALGEQPDASLEQAEGAPRTAEVAALPAVGAVRNVTFVFAGLFDGQDPRDGFVFAGDPRALGARVTRGRLPDPRAPGEFTATQSWLDAAGADLGDQLQLLTISSEQAATSGFDVTEPDGPTVAATLVGVLSGPTQLQDPTPLTVFPASLLDAGDVGVAATVGVVSLTDGSTVEDLRSQLDGLADGADFGLGPAEWVPPEVRRAVRAQGQGLAVVAVVVGAAGVAVLGQLLSRRSRRDGSQRQALAALGLTRAQAVAEPVVVAAVPVVGGALASGLVAYLASGLFPAGLAAQVEPNPGLRFDPLAHLLGPLLLAATVLSWMLVAVVVGGRRRAGTVRSSRVELVAGRLRAGPAAMGMRFALGHHPRDGGAPRAPVLGLVIVLAILVGALTFGASVDRFLAEPARFGLNFDFATGSGGDSVPDDVRDVLRDDPAISDVTLFGTVFAAVGTESLDVTGMEQLRGELEPELLAGRLPLRADEMAVGRASARRLGLAVDDVVEVRGAGGPTRFLVTGLAVIPGVEGGDGLGHGGLVTAAGLRHLDPDAQMSVAAARLRPGADAALAEVGEELGLGLGLPDPPPEVLNVERVRSTPVLVAAALAALVLLSLSHQLISSARRRQRDLAILRVLGADGRWVAQVPHWQVTVLVGAVALVAIPFGVALGRFVYQPFIDRLGARTDISVPYGWLLLALAALVVLGNVAAAIPARWARHARPSVLLARD